MVARAWTPGAWGSSVRTWGEVHIFTTPGRHSLMSVQVARSERSTAVYLRGGVVF